MKKIFLVCALCLAAIGVAAGTVNDLLGTDLLGSQPAYAGNGEDPKAGDIYAGLWREGKAVFSDWLVLDYPIPEQFRRGYKPTQPINYSHKVHVEKNQIECQYCHSGVDRSSYATVPALSTCMGCHLHVMQDSPEIKKLKEYWDKNEPVQWVPVNNLPEHVQFNHQRHIKAGVGCQKCHGLVQEMDVVERVSSLKMGFCVSCHRENGASIDCGICHY